MNFNKFNSVINGNDVILGLILSDIYVIASWGNEVLINENVHHHTSSNSDALFQLQVAAEIRYD